MAWRKQAVGEDGRVRLSFPSWTIFGMRSVKDEVEGSCKERSRGGFGGCNYRCFLEDGGTKQSMEMDAMTSTACCDWYGVDCDSTGRVTGLSIFQDDNLTGTITPAIADLPHLNNLLLNQLPKLSGTIPTALAGLKNIQLFRIMNTAVSGPLSGAIPSSLANLPNLQALHLDHNRLSGAVPASFGSFSKDSPPDLYLFHNSLTGTIPAFLGGPNWGIIDLSWNQIASDASFLFGSSKPATQIDLSRNMLSFDLTDVSFPTKLTLLDLSHNKIYGGIPAQINQVTGLVQFNVSYNELCGEIPAGALTAKFGQSSYSNNKCLCGGPLAACK
ncbi:polygalacturonase inhibitor 2-like [Elaeis guineensis]|uniref:polygalacturonase inhibitor 2-like n=1 Tax=Elaeis guineensis var. tenera TaxID=51953 RepID=UPI003C6D3EA4